jgi:predicted membrane-bound spermidine synthase
MLAIYGLPVGLLAAGALIPRLGFAATASIYALVGLASIALIAVVWWRHLWPAAAPANAA